MRYPFDPIDRRFPFRPTGGSPDEPLGLAALLGTSNARIGHYRKAGLTVDAADRMAVRLGMHPAQLWPSWFEDAEDEPGCLWGGELVPLDRRTLCSHQCRDLMREERKRDAGRRYRWWARLDRYRESVVLEVVA